MKLELIERFERRAREEPDVLALRQAGSAAAPERRITRGELAAWTGSLAAQLEDAIAPGGVVLICAPNQPEFTAAFLAALSAGLRAFPISPELAEPELISAAQRSAAAAVIGTPAAIDLLADRVAVRIAIDHVATLAKRLFHKPCGAGVSSAFSQDETRAGRPRHGKETASNASSPSRSHDSAGLFLLSSGTTGRPKIVFRDAHSLDAVSDAMTGAIGFTETDHVLACVPLCHSYGIEHGLLAPLWAGSCVHLSRGFELRVVLRELSDSGISIFPGVPFMFEMLAQHARDGASFPRLRRAYSAGGPLPRNVADAFRSKFGMPVTQLYGATEIGSVSYSDPDLPGFDPGSVGRPMNGVNIRILRPDALEVDRPLPVGEQGHVAVSAASMLSGYLGEDSPPTANGYFLTGDLGRLDEFENLTITGRIKLLIDVGGLKVNPVEVEEILAQHPGVASCVVVPMRVSETVSRLKAIVTPRPESVAPSASSLREFARTRLAGYKVPRLFEVRESLPKSPAGKILRHLVEA